MIFSKLNRKRPSSLFTRKESLQARFPFGLRTLSNGGRSELRGDRWNPSKKRGVKQVLLFASDGLAGMRDAVSAEILQLFEEKLQAAHKQDVV